MSGEKLTDEEVLAAHKIVPLCGEPRSSPTLPSLSYLPCLLLVPCLPAQERWSGWGWGAWHCRLHKWWRLAGDERCGQSSCQVGSDEHEGNKMWINLQCFGLQDALTCCLFFLEWAFTLVTRFTSSKKVTKASSTAVRIS